MLREKNVTGISAVDHTLPNIDATPGDIDLIIYIDHLIDRSAVNAHPHPNIGVVFQSLVDLQCTSNGLFWTAKEKERHPVSRRHADQLARYFRRPKTFRAAHNLFQFLQELDLFVDQQFRVTNYVD